MTEHERMACDAIIAEAYKGIADLEAELATLREELAATKRKFERARQERSHAEIERDTLRAENASLKRDLWTVFEHARMYLPHLKEGFSVYDIAKEAMK